MGSVWVAEARENCRATNVKIKSRGTLQGAAWRFEAAIFDLMSRGVILDLLSQEPSTNRSSSVLSNGFLALAVHSAIQSLTFLEFCLLHAIKLPAVRIR